MKLAYFTWIVIQTCKLAIASWSCSRAIFLAPGPEELCNL